MASQNLLRNIHPEGQFIAAGVVLELATDGDKPRVVASDYLILDETLLERVALLERSGLLPKHL